MRRSAIAAFTLLSIILLVLIAVITAVLLNDEDEEEPAATPALTEELMTEAPTAAPTATPSPATRAPTQPRTSPEPSGTPRPTTTPAATATPPPEAGAIDVSNAPSLAVQETIVLEGAPDQQNAIRSFAWSPDGSLLAVPEPANGRVQLYDAATFAPLQSIAAQNQAVRTVAFSPDGATLATGALEIELWDVATGENVGTLQGHASPVLGLSFSPDGTTVASTSADQFVRLWDVSSGAQLRQLALGAAGTQVRFSPDGATVAGLGERLVRLWVAASGEEIATLEHPALALGMAFSPDGNQIATSAFDGAVRVWEVAGGAEAEPAILLPPDADAVPLALDYNLDGTLLAVGSYSRPTLDLIDADSGNLVVALGADPLNTAARFAPDGRRLAALSGQFGGSLIVWGLPEE